jgi:hypothetical protein
MHKLMIKTHNTTGLKYLCYTRKKDHLSYLGSGKIWKRHIKKHGEDITTEIIFQTENKNEFIQFATQKSLEFNVVNSDEWANLKIEEGDGGDTVSKKKWITDGKQDKYLDNSKLLPEGWIYGRANCVFNSSEKQKEFSSRSDRVKAGISIKLAWDEGRFKRDHSKCGVSGDLNVSKIPEVREKISQWAKNNSIKTSERAKKVKFWEYSSRGHNKNI